MTSLPTESATLFASNFLALRQLAEQPGFDGSALLEQADNLFEHFEPDSADAHRFSGVISHLYDLSGDNRLNQREVSTTLDRLRDAPETSIVPGYSYFEMIERGGEATVYRALNRGAGLERLVALKIAQTFGEKTQAARTRRLKKLDQNFSNEWSVLQSFDSPYVIKAHALGRTQTGKPYLALEYMDRGALNVYVRERIRAHRAGDHLFPIQERLHIAVQMASALAVFHESDRIHNDVKLGNFLLNRRGQIKIADPSMSSSSSESSKISFRGTPGHLSAETHPTFKRDVFALGTSLYILFTGKVPFDPKKVYTVMIMPPVPSTFDPSIPKRLDRVIMDALRAPSERTPDAMTLLAQLERLA